jgi:hypothetical protein
MRVERWFAVVSVGLCLSGAFFSVRVEAAPQTSSTKPGPSTVTVDQEGTYQLLRCLFSERRAVIRHEGKLVVLHEGDPLPGSDLRVDTLSDTKMVITGGGVSRAGSQGAVMVPRTIIIIEKEQQGVRITRMSDTPGADEMRLPVSQPASSIVSIGQDGSLTPAPTFVSKPR